MSNVITLTPQPPKPTSATRYEEIAVYGTVGPISVALARRTREPEGLIHVVVMGSAIGLEMVATLPDDEKGRAIADFIGPAVLRAVELAETEFTSRPEAC